MLQNQGTLDYSQGRNVENTLFKIDYFLQMLPDYIMIHLYKIFSN